MAQARQSVVLGSSMKLNVPVNQGFQEFTDSRMFFRRFRFQVSELLTLSVPRCQLPQLKANKKTLCK